MIIGHTARGSWCRVVEEAWRRFRGSNMDVYEVVRVAGFIWGIGLRDL